MSADLVIGAALASSPLFAAWIIIEVQRFRDRRRERDRKRRRPGYLP